MSNFALIVGAKFPFAVMIASRFPKNFRKNHAALGLALLSASTILVPARAQTEHSSSALIKDQEPAPVPVPRDHASLYNTTIALRSIKPSVAAYWLNPVRVAAPSELRGPQTSSNSPWQTLPRLPGNGNGPAGLKLPDGIEAVAPLDNRNELLVRGTTEGVEALKKLVATFDVPLVQYEIETRFIQVSRSNLAQLGINFSSVKWNSPYEFGDVSSVPVDIQSRLAALFKRKQVNVMPAPRVLVIDGLEGSTQQQIAMPIEIDSHLSRRSLSQKTSLDAVEASSEPNFSQPTTDVSPGFAVLYSNTGVRVGVLARTGRLLSLWLSPSFGNRSLTVETTVREDQSFAIQMSSPKDKQQLVAIVTPRRVHRVGEARNKRKHL